MLLCREEHPRPREILSNLTSLGISRLSGFPVSGLCKTWRTSGRVFDSGFLSGLIREATAFYCPARTFSFD